MSCQCALHVVCNSLQHSTCYLEFIQLFTQRYDRVVISVSVLIQLTDGYYEGVVLFCLLFQLCPTLKLNPLFVYVKHIFPFCASLVIIQMLQMLINVVFAGTKFCYIRAVLLYFIVDYSNKAIILYVCYTWNYSICPETHGLISSGLQGWLSSEDNARGLSQSSTACSLCPFLLLLPVSEHSQHKISGLISQP